MKCQCWIVPFRSRAVTQLSGWERSQGLAGKPANGVWQVWAAPLRLTMLLDTIRVCIDRVWSPAPHITVQDALPGHRLFTANDRESTGIARFSPETRVNQTRYTAIENEQRLEYQNLRFGNPLVAGSSPAHLMRGGRRVRTAAGSAGGRSAGEGI